MRPGTTHPDTKVGNSLATTAATDYSLSPNNEQGDCSNPFLVPLHTTNTTSRPGELQTNVYGTLEETAT